MGYTRNSAIGRDAVDRCIRSIAGKVLSARPPSSLSPIESLTGPTGSAQHRKQFGSDKDFDAARNAGLPPDQPSSFESEHHLVDRGRTDAKVPLEIGFGGRSAEDARIGIDERQILTLLWRETQDRR